MMSLAPYPSPPASLIESMGAFPHRLSRVCLAILGISLLISSILPFAFSSLISPTLTWLPGLKYSPEVPPQDSETRHRQEGELAPIPIAWGVPDRVQTERNQTANYTPHPMEFAKSEDTLRPFCLSRSATSKGGNTPPPRAIYFRSEDTLWPFEDTLWPFWLSHSTTSNGGHTPPPRASHFRSEDSLRRFEDSLRRFRHSFGEPDGGGLPCCTSPRQFRTETQQPKYDAPPIDAVHLERKTAFGQRGPCIARGSYLHPQGLLCRIGKTPFGGFGQRGDHTLRWTPLHPKVLLGSFGKTPFGFLLRGRQISPLGLLDNFGKTPFGGFLDVLGRVGFAGLLGEGSVIAERERGTAGTRLLRVLLQQDYNTRMVLWGTGLLGGAAGAVGVFMLLRKRALMGDVVSHASLPGIALAYMAMEMAWPGEGKSLIGLLTGGTLGGILGVLGTTAIRRWTRIHDDAALAIILSVFFGFGISLLTVIQRLPGGNAAGLSSFIYGKAAAMTSGDVQAIALVAAIVGGVCLILLKEFTVLCFDDRYAAAQGWPTVALDLLLMGLVVTVTVIGLQSVGLLLVVALLIIPAASARFWTDRLGMLILLAILAGMAMSLLGVIISSLVPRVATGAVIVLSGTSLFTLSLLLGTRRGLLRRALRHRRSQRRAKREHLLRGMYELLEGRRSQGSTPDRGPGFQDRLGIRDLQPLRSWSNAQLERLVWEAQRRGWLTRSGHDIRFTSLGLAEARRLVRNHRLWELYLIHYADTAPAQVDRNADRIEHLLDADLLADLENKLADDFVEVQLPESPHGG